MRNSRFNLRASLCVAALVAGGLISADASAALNLLEKLLAPAVGTKPGFSEGKKTYDEDTLKPEELKECILIAHRYDEREVHRPFDPDEITKAREDLKKEGEQIKRRSIRRTTLTGRTR
jgi:hypothetical protein